MPFRGEIFHWWNHSVSSGSQVTSFFGAILLLNLSLSNYSIPRSEHWPYRLVQKAQHHLPLFILEQDESVLLRPRDLLPLLRSSNLLPCKFKPIFPIKVLGLRSCSVSLVSFALCVLRFILKHLSDWRSPSLSILFPIMLLFLGHWFPTILPFPNHCWTTLNPILVVSVISLDAFLLDADKNV